MKKSPSGSIVYSPSDIIRFLESPFASWMERLHLEFPDRVLPDEDSEELKIIAAEGNRHEERFLDQLREEGRAVTVIDRGHGSIGLTQEALERADEVIFQAHLADASFAGYADFVVSGSDGVFEIWDTKLARSPKPYYLVQLCCYAELLESMGFRRPHTLRIVLGNGEIQAFRTADYYYAYQEAKRAFVEQMAVFDPAQPPVPDPGADHGHWASHAERELITRDHLVQVAGISSGQIAKLEEAGITTMAALSETPSGHVSGITDKVFRKLVHQARLQVKTRSQRITDGEAARPAFEVLPHAPSDVPQGLELLPPASPNDIFFDLEGYPLAEGGTGLEYLFGASYLDPEGERQFIDWWAHSPAEEKRAFEAFIDWAHARWIADPSLHIYHYAAYEITALTRLMGAYGTRESEVDDLLRNGVFVDLYKVVRQGLRLGEDSYSLKKVERLYMDARDGDVQTAAASIVFYARWLESEESGDWRESAILREIRDYNREDCDSTLDLTNWLRAQQHTHGIAFRPTIDRETIAPTILPDAVRQRQVLAATLLEEADGSEGAEAETFWLLAHLLDYHRREDKPVWWALFARCAMTHEELLEDGDCLGALTRLDLPAVPIKRSTGFWFAFDAGQDSKLGEGDTAILSADRSIKVEITEIDREAGRVLLKFGPSAMDKLDEVIPPVLSLVPDEFVKPDPMPAAIEQIAMHWQQSRQLPSCLRKFLRREGPLGSEHRPLMAPEADATKGAVRVAQSMQGAALCIQGPPGTGKTYTGAQVIAALLADGKRIGVVSNSHKAILNLLATCHEQIGDSFTGIKCGGSARDAFFKQCPGVRHIAGSTKAVEAYGGGLIAGTAWLFARPDMRRQLDYLIIDEAGQVSLANLVAMSGSTENLIMLGDQMQLAQPVKGSHPGESGQSALSYYLNGHATIPAHLGIFLPETRRMRPEICAFISDAVYDERLQAHPDTQRFHIDGVTPGIQFEPVEHEGNCQESNEESTRVATLIHDLLGKPYHDGTRTCPLALSDILVVTPYNRQVRNLQRHLPNGARVGTVDKFQGQEAAVVIFSMGSSAGETGSRGLAFLLDKNRLNVALSRARCLAIVVADPRHAQAGYSSVADMARLNLFCRFHAGSHLPIHQSISETTPSVPLA